MKNKKDKVLNRLKGDRFIEIFRLEDADDSIFDNYQRYDFHQVIWFTRVGGNDSYFLDFNEYQIKDNQVIVVFPGQIDMLDTRHKEGYLFAIHNDVFFRINQHIQSHYLNGYFTNTFINLDCKTQIILKKLMELMLEEYQSDNRITLMENYMEAILFHVDALFEYSETFKEVSDSMMSQLMRLIDKHFITNRDIYFYADQLGITPKKMNEISIKGTGKTVKQHIQERLVLEIKKEIRLRPKGLKEIAFDLGFSEPAYFTRFFKQQTGITPTEFREGGKAETSGYQD